MEKQTDQTAIMMNRLQEREREQMLILSICSALAQALTKEEFNAVVSSLLKEELQFDDFVFASSNQEETEYQIFYQFSHKQANLKCYVVNDGFFNVCLDDADTVIFDLKSVLDKKSSFPDYINNVQNKGFKNGLGVCLPAIKENQNVLFLFFKNAVTFTRESNRVLRGIAMQLSITARNIKISEEYESKIAELKILKRNLAEKKLETTNTKTEGFHGIVGSSNAMQDVYELIEQVAPSQSTVLIFGETGTGKELVASAIHNLSSVSTKRMIKVNCASIPVNLIESELFGHEKGAFTGAVDLRIGKFEQAENSTIFLDEIGELPLELQGKLLRVLQEKEIERIGGKTTIKVNARVIAATNKSLLKEVAEDRFRSDLYYRLNVYPIPLPALRDRREDIAVLSNFFLEKHSIKIGKKITGFSKKVLNSMTANAWPGNVRELENMVERSILFAKEEVIKEMSFPVIFMAESKTTESEFYPKTLQEVEKEHILRVVKKCNGRISGPQGAAVLLDLPGTTLISKMQKLGIKKEHFLG
ncbi:sigma 54-interacting transcriptional regulator [Flavobacterium sp. MC2016-06]|uniref:sigma-54 interaction domain-containing protein n=1 Tax=Flavobacterium sp. MC2016-06 TaxID=2676308 RepID=UPI0012BACAD7|nr:sigma 54-interacting transcriptional regulator [Flavobacterium sp. MC2016-06]MBU3859640.1 sigma 54-interacting transcriptional regulator [Flavobacterium sp. MC2016-06]